MNSSPRFTVILAGYQTAPYLPESLSSVSGQTFKDFEAICYVEESTDDSLEICEEHARKDPRFKVATGPKSGGVGSTRNYGIDHASGEYLVVLDGDDRLSRRLLEKLALKLQEIGEADVVAFSAVTVPDGETDPEKLTLLTNFRKEDASGVFSGREALLRAGRHGGQFRAYTWLCAYRTQFLRENRFYQTVGLCMEDFEWAPRVWFAAEKFAYLDEIAYVYRRRGGSLTTESSSRLVLDLAKQLCSLLEFASEKDIPENLKRIWSNQWLSVLYWFLFHPISSGKISDGDRKKALETLFAPPCGEKLRALAAFASGPKRAPLPLLLLGAKGLVFPARLYFQFLYYPLNDMRQGKKRTKTGEAGEEKSSLHLPE